MKEERISIEVEGKNEEDVMEGIRRYADAYGRMTFPEIAEAISKDTLFEEVAKRMKKA